MTKAQIAKDNSNERASDFLNKNDTELKTNNLYLPLKTSFNAKMALMAVAKQKQFEQVTPITNDKNLLREVVVNTVFPLASKACVQAYGLNKPELGKSLDHPITYLSKTSDDDLVGRSTDLLKIMSDNIGILTQLDPDDITAMQTAISDFVAIKDRPQAEIKEKKAKGTDPIPGLLDDIDVDKHSFTKLIQSSFSHLFPTWKDEIKIGAPIGTRKTSMIIRYFDLRTGMPLTKVKSSAGGILASKVKYSTAKGYVRFYGLDSGNYTLTSELQSYITDVKNNIGVSDSQVVNLDIRLQIIVPTGTLDLLVLDAVTGNPLSGALLSVPSISYQATTPASGRLLKNDLSSGTYEAILTCNNCKPLNFTFTIKNNETISLQFSLEKAS
jgi:hypothetical protein